MFPRSEIICCTNTQEMDIRTIGRCRHYPIQDTSMILLTWVLVVLFGRLTAVISLSLQCIMVSWRSIHKQDRRRRYSQRSSLLDSVSIMLLFSTLLALRIVPRE